VETVPVGGFEDEVVHRAHRFGVPDDGLPLPPDVARESDVDPLPGGILGLDPDHRGSQDVPGVGEARLRAFHGDEVPSIGYGHEAPYGLHRVLGIVEGLEIEGLAPLRGLLGEVLLVSRLDRRGIHHDEVR
jgi:hypothetical protein